jgi:hypothetical protein
MLSAPLLPTGSAPALGAVTFARRTVDLALAFEAEVEAVVLRRPLPPALRASAAALLGAPATVRVVVEVGAAAAGLAATLGPGPLADDVAAWAECLAELTGAAAVGVRLERLAHAMCPRLHADRVLARVVCTYAGAGTELVARAQVDAAHLGRPGTTDGDVLHPGATLVQARAGDVVLMKGALWPGCAGAVHRSPAAGPDHPRLVLTLDPLAA